MSVTFSNEAAALSARTAAAHRRQRRQELLTSLWGRVRPWLVLASPIAFLIAALVFAALAMRAEHTKATINALKADRDISVATNATPEALLARIGFLLAHDREDEVQPYVEALDKTGSEEARAVAHYNSANGRLRQAFDLIIAGKLDGAGPLVVLSRQEYRHALTFAPDDWDAKFNLDVASRLIRDFPAFERTIGDEVKIDRKKIWTDVPGKPEGLP